MKIWFMKLEFPTLAALMPIWCTLILRCWKNTPYQRLEIMVTGTNHVLVCTPEYYDGAIDEEVTITLHASGDLKIVSKGGNNDEN